MALLNGSFVHRKIKGSASATPDYLERYLDHVLAIVEFGEERSAKGVTGAKSAKSMWLSALHIHN